VDARFRPSLSEKNPPSGPTVFPRLDRARSKSTADALTAPLRVRIRGSSTVLPVLIVLLAAALRLFALDRVPPGLYYDESANGVDAIRVLQGIHPIFFVGNQGREPLIIYLQATTIALIGPSPLALRLPTAMVGILTVAATIITFRRIFGSRVGLFSGFLLAVSYWHLSLSRLAFPAGMLPLFVTLSVYWFWKASHGGRFFDFGLAGAALGLGIYTYIPSRLTPLLFAVWLTGMLSVSAWRKTIAPTRLLVGGLVGGSLFVVVVSPLAGYFYKHPDEFLGRIQAEQATQPGVTLLEDFSQSVGALVATGDPNPRQNLPGQPLIAVPVSLAWLVGIVIALRRWRDGVSIFLLLCCALMLAPAALSHEPSHALRLVGELPFVLVVAALGFDWLVDRRWPRRWPLGAILVGLSFTFIGISTARSYFVVWAANADTYQAFESDTLRVTALLSRVPTGDPAFATGDVYQGQPIPAVLDPRAMERARIFDGLRDFVTPAESGKPVYYAFSSSRTPGSGIPASAHLSLVATSRDGRLFRMDPPLSPPLPGRPADARIGRAIQINGVDVQPVVAPGQSERFALYWTVIGTLPPGDWTFFAHVVRRDNQQLIGQDYNQGFAPDQWRVGDRVASSFSIPIPSTAPATVATVDAGLLDQSSGRRLALTDPSGRPAGAAFISGPVRIDRPSNIPTAQHPLAVRFGPAMKLDGYDVDRQSDGSLALRLHWTADRPVGQDYTVFVHAVDHDGHLIAGADGEPGQGEFPTSTWTSGEEILDSHIVRIPAGHAAGLHLEVGVYLLSTGQRLPAIGADGRPLGDFITILL